MGEISEMDLDEIRLNYQKNIYQKEMIVLESQEHRKGEKRSEKILTYRDWIIEFLKNQVLMRDELMEQQNDLLEKNDVNHEVDYNGLYILLISLQYF